MKRVYDVSLPIFEGMPVYKNKPEKQPKFEVVSDFQNASAHETRVHLDVHTGTHIDAQLHMIPGGSTTESISVDQLVRPCRVVDLTDVQASITSDDLRNKHIQANEFLLLKTTNSGETAFNPEFVFLSEDGARYLAGVGIAGVGIDALGVERSQPGHPTHKALFSCGAVIIEGLNLSDVPEGTYLMVAAPLKLLGLDAAPARVYLLEQT